jgi:ketosteroid isomerase-like protein
MRSVTMLVVALLVSAPALASDPADVMAPIHQFLDSANRGDTKTALAACASPASVIDEFPPHEWQGANACANWFTDFDSYNKKSDVTDPVAKVGKPHHVDITGDRAYVVLPATYTYKQNGKTVTERNSTMTVALQKAPTGWLITGWAWSKR